ncbi:MAG TPA: hypothetical protein VMY77_15650 [Chitinophagaceae bacterium]|nr:hypothetical protein [Chitinophagaceae bacterium]
MKKKLLTIAVLILSVCISSTSFAQGDTGGSAGASLSVTTPQPTGYHFTRNNGDGNILGQAQIKLYYTSAPAIPPELTDILYNGLPLFVNFAPVTADITNFASTGYVVFYIPTSNIPPAIKLTLIYNASSTQKNLTISGTD